MTGLRTSIGKWSLATYFVVFLLFIYGPMIIMAVLSFQGRYGGITFPFRGPLSGQWWQSIVDSSVPGSKATEIGTSATQSLKLSLAAGAVTTLLAFGLSMAFRRRFRGDGVAFYLIMLALMTPGFLVALGTQLFWKSMAIPTSVWKSALGTNTIWGIPFGFLVMLAVWNRYDDHIEEAARDLGADQKTTFREVTLPLVWTGLFGCFLFGFTLTWNDYDRTALLLNGSEAVTLPIQIFAQTQFSAIRPDLYALGSATTGLSLLVIFLALVIALVRMKMSTTSGGPEKAAIKAEETGQAEAFHLEETSVATASTPASGD
jgi:putative spermidine/putrescine transport system permease protein